MLRCATPHSQLCLLQVSKSLVTGSRNGRRIGKSGCRLVPIAVPFQGHEEMGLGNPQGPRGPAGGAWGSRDHLSLSCRERRAERAARSPSTSLPEPPPANTGLRNRKRRRFYFYFQSRFFPIGVICGDVEHEGLTWESAHGGIQTA